MIENDDDLRRAVGEASSLVQEIHDYVTSHPQSIVDIKVRFPRGFLRTNAQARRSTSVIQKRLNNLRNG